MPESPVHHRAIEHLVHIGYVYFVLFNFVDVHEINKFRGVVVEQIQLPIEEVKICTQDVKAQGLYNARP